MTSFSSPAQPILRRKQPELDVQDLQGLFTIHWQINHLTLFSRFYTRIDQVFLMWGIVCTVLFLVPQFVPLSWTVQAGIATVLTIVGAYNTVSLSWYWVTVEQLRWVVYLWVALVLLGIGLTNLGLFGGFWLLLTYLCPLWLGLCAVGYLITAWGLRSRAFLGSSLVHLLGIVILPHIQPWQYLVTGLISAGTLFLLAETQWDMQSCSDYRTLTEAQKQFNQEQQHLRTQLLRN
jgi:hypothetical protein